MVHETRLKVCDPSGKVIIATTELSFGTVLFVVPFLEVVKKDNPEFAEEGVISFIVPQPEYAQAKKTITNYLEDLFLKELNNEIIHPSDGNKPLPGRSKTKSSGGNSGKTEGENDNPVCDRGGRGKQAKSERGRPQNSDVAKSSDKNSGGESKTGN